MIVMTTRRKAEKKPMIEDEEWMVYVFFAMIFAWKLAGVFFGMGCQLRGEIQLMKFR